MICKKILAVMIALSCLAMVGCNDNTDSDNTIIENTSQETIANTEKNNSETNTNSYAEKLSEKNVMEINIISDAWENLMQNATSKPWISCDIEIDGELFKNVGIKTKGNTSLSQITQMDTERYSLKIKFDKYVDGQSYYGLDKLALNNIYSDNTYLKEYLSYDLFQFMDVPGSLCRFTKIMVNGEYYGFYIAIEDPDDSFIARNFGENSNIKAYKPEAMEMNGKNGIEDMLKGDMGDMFSSMLKMTNKDGNEVNISDVIGDITQIKGVTLSDGTEVMLENNGKSSDMRELMQIDFTDIISVTDSDGNHIDISDYTIEFNSPGDGEFFRMPVGGNDNMPDMPGNEDFPQDGNPSEMSDGEKIFKAGSMDGGRNGVNLVYSDDEFSSYSNIFENNITKIDDTDKTRLIASLKGISEGEDLENYINIDEVLRYTACNVFLTNLDSYFGTLCHNYILMEDNGILSMIPWDYNLAFGANECKNSFEAVNYAIDTVFSGVMAEERPIISKLLENEEYFQKYHEYLQKICTEYMQSGLFEQKIDEITSIIDEYVKQDTTAFCTYEEYQKGITALKLFGKLRAESVLGQLEGSIPSVTEEQSNSTALINTSDLDLTVLGSMNQDRKGMGGGMDMPDGNMMPGGGMPDGNMPDGDMPGSNMPDRNRPDKPKT